MDPADREDVFTAVRDCLADSLAVDPDEITPSSRLVDDLGADSLDIIEMVFVLERKFGIKARDTELSYLARLDFSSTDVIRDGHLTPAVVDKLRPSLPALDTVPDRASVTPGQLLSLITVETLCRIIASRMPPG